MRYAYLAIPALFALIVWSFLRPEPPPAWLHQEYGPRHVLHTTDTTIRIGLGVVCEAQSYTIGIVTAEAIKSRKQQLKAQYQFDDGAWLNTVIGVDNPTLLHFSEVSGPFLQDLLTHQVLRLRVGKAEVPYEFGLVGLREYGAVIRTACGEESK